MPISPSDLEDLKREFLPSSLLQAARRARGLDELPADPAPMPDGPEDYGLSPARTEQQDEAPADDPRDDIPMPASAEDFGLSADEDQAPEAEIIRLVSTTPEPRCVAVTPAKPVLPFEMFDASQWEGMPIEPRRWIAHNRIPVGEPGIMSGDGGTGKTKLALQLAAAVAAELKEMHRRTADVLDHRQLSFRDLRGQMHFICDQDDPVLGATDRNGVVQPTMSLLRLEKTVALVRPALVIIENAADVYSGNEVDRPNVTRFMRGLLGRLTVPCESTVMLIQHPSVSGLNDGTGRSGSTGWNNAGRWRCNFTKPKNGDGERDDGMRQLEIVKNNYGPTGEKFPLRWERGVFVPEGTASSPQRAAAERKIEELFLELLDKRNAQGRPVHASTAKGNAATEFEGDPDSQGVKAIAFRNSMERLLTAGQITLIATGSAAKRRTHLERASQ